MTEKNEVVTPTEPKQKASAQVAEKKNAPAYTVKDGEVRGSVFLATTSKGVTFPRAVIARRYKGKDGKWQNSSSFNRNDLASLEVVRKEIELFLDSHFPERALG